MIARRWCARSGGRTPQIAAFAAVDRVIDFREASHHDVDEASEA
jgi:hypothetical protein